MVKNAVHAAIRYDVYYTFLLNQIRKYVLGYCTNNNIKLKHNAKTGRN